MLKTWNASQICTSSLPRGHDNLYIISILVYVLPKQAQYAYFWIQESLKAAHVIHRIFLFAWTARKLSISQSTNNKCSEPLSLHIYANLTLECLFFPSPRFPFTCFSCFLILLPHICFCMQPQILFGKSQGSNECIKMKKGYFFYRGDFYRWERNVIRTRHDLAWWVHTCFCRICIYTSEALWSLSFSKLSWSSGFRGHLYLEDFKGKNTPG